MNAAKLPGLDFNQQAGRNLSTPSNTFAAEIDRDQSGPLKGVETSASFNLSPERKIDMSKGRIEGAAQKAVGAAKQAVGKAVGNPKLQAEGMSDRVVGSAKEVVGKLQDAVHKASR